MSVPSNDFSPEVRDIFECFDFYTQVDRLEKSNLLYLVAEKFANIDFHPNVVSNARMGTVFEELIRKFAELSNETAGEHFTPREVAGSGRLGSQRHSSAGRGLEKRTSRGERVFPAKSGNMERFFREYGVATILQHAAAKLMSPENTGAFQRASASRFLQQPAANSASELPNLVHQAILQIPWYQK